jgi:nucleotide-binding universal stress UspA family protein
VGETRESASSDEQGQRPAFLVAYGTGPMSDAQLHMACRAANDVGAMVRVLHVVVRTRHLPLSVPLSAGDLAAAEALLDRAEQIAQTYGVTCEMEIVQAPEVGDAIVSDACEHQVRAIFIGLRDRDRPGVRLFLSATVRRVLRNAPCPVYIGYLPANLPDEAARDAMSASPHSWGRRGPLPDS